MADTKRTFRCPSCGMQLTFTYTDCEPDGPPECIFAHEKPVPMVEVAKSVSA